MWSTVSSQQDAYVAKLKLKHEQDRQMALLKQGKKIEPGSDMVRLTKSAISIFRAHTTPPPRQS